MESNRETKSENGPILPAILGLVLGAVCIAISLFFYMSHQTPKLSYAEAIPILIGAAIGVLVMLLSGWKLVQRCKE